jgi:hypothetical protein
MEGVFWTTFKLELRRWATYEPRENDVIIDFPIIEDNKAAGSDSIAAELLKSGGPGLVNALN